MKPLTQEQLDQLQDLVASGFTNTEIAQRLGCDRHTIGRYIKKFNLVKPNQILIGKQYNSLTVIEKTNERSANGDILWKCRCVCGQDILVKSSSLNNGTVKSCGCSRLGNGLINLINSKFGKLTVIAQASSRDASGGCKWICKCECGSVVEVSGVNLRRGDTSSCGCLNSRGEYYIKQYLNDHNIEYQTQYTFPDLLSRKEALLRFDFAIFKNGKLNSLIEFQGPQHYDKNNQWHTQDLEYNDNKKIEYCKNHGYNLILITDINSINSTLERVIYGGLSSN